MCVYEPRNRKMTLPLMVKDWIVHCNNLAILGKTTTICLYTSSARSKLPWEESVWMYLLFFEIFLSKQICFEVFRTVWNTKEKFRDLIFEKVYTLHKKSRRPGMTTNLI